MPICSYLVYPTPGRFDAAVAALNAMPTCDAVPDDQGRIVILVTDTPTEQANRDLYAELAAMDDIECIAMTYGQFASTP